MKTLKILFGLGLLIIITACKTSGADTDAFLKQVFDEKEVILVNQIIRYYDNFVLNKTDQNKSIEDAYLEFATKNVTLAEKEGNLDLLAPSREERVAFFDTLDKDVLSNIFRITDTIYWYSSPKVVVEAEYYPYQFLTGSLKYLDFIKALSTRNDFYSYYHNGLKATGDISPTIYGSILMQYNNEYPEHVKKFNEAFDFSKKEDRFAFIVPFLISMDNNHHHPKSHKGMHLYPVSEFR
jgi:hypothetical protein